MGRVNVGSAKYILFGIVSFDIFKLSAACYACIAFVRSGDLYHFCCAAYRRPEYGPFGKGQTGSALMNGVTANIMFFFQGLFGYSRSPTFISLKVPGRTFFSNPSKFITFAAAPLVLTPFVRNQTSSET